MHVFAFWALQVLNLFFTDNIHDIFELINLRSWRYCVGARLKFWRRSRVPNKGSRDEAVEIPITDQ